MNEVKIKLTQTFLEKNFTVEHNKKTYYVSYLDSDGPILGLSNRDTWEVIGEDGEELNVYILQDTTEEEKQQIKENIKLANKLISFCIRHFNDYKPEI